MIKPRKGYKFMKLDVISKKGSYIGQLWYEYCPAFPITVSEIKSVIEHRFPQVGNGYTYEEIKSQQLQPIEKVRVYRRTV